MQLDAATPPAYDATLSSSSPSSPLRLPFELPVVDPLPSYSRNHRSGEFSFPSPTDYLYATKSMSLNLGKRINGTSIPSYGKNGLIQGMLTVTSFDHVKEVSVTISGEAAILVSDPCLGSVTHREQRTLLSHKIVLWSYSSNISAPIRTQHYPITYTLPTFSALNDLSTLPPTRAASSQNVSLEVRYTIRADITRYGLYRHEVANAPFLYLPRSIPRPPQYQFDYKSEPKDVLDWGVFNAASSSGVHDHDAIVKLQLPLPLSYPSGLPIPFRASIESASPNLTAELVQARLSVQLVKLIYVHAGSHRIPLDRTLQTGHKWRVVEAGGEPGVWEVSGSIDGVKPGSETAWTLSRFIEVKYAVRLVMQKVPNVVSEFVCEVPVELVTDQAEDLQYDKDAGEYPALGLIQQQQHLS